MHAPSSNASPATVLVVDDEPFVRVVVAEALAEAGCLTCEAENAETALDLLNANPNIDALVADVRLPGTLDGHQLAIEAYRLCPDLKVIFMTGDSQMASTLEKLPGLADGVLIKPFHLRDLRRLMAHLFEAKAWDRHAA
jgi:DNA-binding NtrC family response regulator